MQLINALLSLYIITKPLYFWASGLPQVSDIILVVAFILTLFTYGPKETKKTIKKNIHFVIFIIFVFLINMIYSIYYEDLGFSIKTLYYVFDALGIITFTIALENNKKTNKTLRTAFMMALLIQLSLYFLHIGKYYGGIRYMGTFNDPNQYAYYCLLAYGYIYLLEEKQNKLNFLNVIFLIIAIFLIAQSASIGMLLGISIFMVFYGISIINKVLNNIHKYALPIAMTTSVIIFITSFFFLTPIGNGIIEKVNSSYIISRLEEKTAKSSDKQNKSLWEDRGYDRIVYYPKYILYGAGEGQYSRFEKAAFKGELHATLPSILFCYGIIPLLLVLTWIYRNIKKQHLDTTCVYIAILLESFTLVNSRQVLFWVIFALAKYIGDKNDKK